MDNTRSKNAKYNIIVSLACQLISLVCGFVVPSLMLNAYGSEAYGACSSITQFLAYISLLEGGVGGVARAALYKPLANNDSYGISNVVYEIKRFFRIVGFVFIIYVLFLACFFKKISDVQSFDWFSTFLLVIVISISTFAQYFIGISYSVLMHAAQKTYINNIITIIATILNTCLTIVLIKSGFNIIFVKFVSSCVFVLRPVFLWMYVKRHFTLTNDVDKTSNALNQKWTGLGQHIAYFLHSNTDVAVLTIFTNLTNVSIYSVYHMVVYNIQNITTSFTTGMEALYGDMIAKNEIISLNKVFSRYETLISFITIVLFSTTMVMIIPFIKIYTNGVNDANYIQYQFSFLLVLASIIYCLRIPYHSVVMASGRFRETKMGAYGESLINIVLSIILVIKFGLVGVAIGTVCGTSFRFVYYVLFLKNNVINRNITYFYKRSILNILSFFLICVPIYVFIDFSFIKTYLSWIIVAIMITIYAIIVTLIVNLIGYNQEMTSIIRNIKLKRK